MSPRFTVRINGRLCKGCGICVDVCPRHALVMDGVNPETGYPNPRLEGGCIGCRICMWYCPDQAIVVVPESEGSGVDARGEALHIRQ